MTPTDLQEMRTQVQAWATEMDARWQDSLPDDPQTVWLYRIWQNLNSLEAGLIRAIEAGQ